ncbi:MAG TPA: PHB depolymerase family esterase [Gemmatimonadales bacterium]
MEKNAQNEPSDEGSDDPEDDGRDPTHRVVAGHERTGEQSSDQTHDEHRHDSHERPPFSRIECGDEVLNWKGTPCRERPNGRTPALRDRGEPSIIGGMTREIIARYGIDPRRVYVAGLSAGGAMAAIMKSTHPDLFAAAGVNSGLPYGAAHDLPSALEAMKGRPRSRARPEDLTPLIVFHGDGDKTVHPRNGDEILAQGVPGSGASSTEVQQGRVPDGHPFTRTLYRDGARRVIAEHWVIHGAAHAWSGGSVEGSYVDPRGPDATREMLRFFSLWAQPES